MIKVDDLSFSYTDRDFLQNINFEVEKGEILGFLGPSGRCVLVQKNKMNYYKKLIVRFLFSSITIVSIILVHKVLFS
ncbi:hypothetical protein QRX15_07920, partial [Clostridioides difficile]|nr:hypothetical protein [Clostridioides difficile]